MKYALLYGTLSGAIVIAIISLILALNLPGHLQSEWFGYLVMLLALSLIFVGVKRYRDVERGGVIGFGPAAAIGLGIAAVAGIVYVLGWEIFLATQRTDFIAEYSANLLRGLQESGASAAEIAAKADELRDIADMYRNPFLRTAITFTEIFPVGFVVALVSAAILRNPRVLPAASRV